jgi:hypothetical protein
LPTLSIVAAAIRFGAPLAFPTNHFQTLSGQVFNSKERRPVGCGAGENRGKQRHFQPHSSTHTQESPISDRTITSPPLAATTRAILKQGRTFLCTYMPTRSKSVTHSRIDTSHVTDFLHTCEFRALNGKIYFGLADQSGRLQSNAENETTLQIK